MTIYPDRDARNADWPKRRCQQCGGAKRRRGPLCGACRRESVRFRRHVARMLWLARMAEKGPR